MSDTRDTCILESVSFLLRENYTYLLTMFKQTMENPNNSDLYSLKIQIFGRLESSNYYVLRDSLSPNFMICADSAVLYHSFEAKKKLIFWCNVVSKDLFLCTNSRKDT